MTPRNWRRGILEIYTTFEWSEGGDENKVSRFMEKFEAYCNLRKNVTWERYMFNTCNQREGESIDQYVTDLKTKAKSCEFGVLSESLIKDHIICGILDDGTRSRLLREPNLSLAKALDICRANEAISTQMKHLATATFPKESAESEEVCAIDKSKQRNKTQTDSRRQQCTRCGNRHTHQQLCPATGLDCHKCGRKMCRSTSKKPSICAVTCDNPDEDHVCGHHPTG